MHSICLERTGCVLKISLLIRTTFDGGDSDRGDGRRIGHACRGANDSAATHPTRRPGTLRGQVTDPSGAVVANATVAILVSGGPTHSATPAKPALRNWKPCARQVHGHGKCPGVFHFCAGRRGSRRRPIAQFNIALEINVKQEKVNVEGETPTLDVNPRIMPAQSCSAAKIWMRFPTIPMNYWPTCKRWPDLRPGPMAGSFTSMDLPRTTSARSRQFARFASIQNPFSAEYDRLGYGRIEIFTKPGRTNTRTVLRRGKRLGPEHAQSISRRRSASAIRFRDLPGQHRRPDQQEGIVLFRRPAAQHRRDSRGGCDDPRHKLPADGIRPKCAQPHTRTNLSPRIDYQVGPNNTLTTRYQYYRDTQQNAGVGGLVLPEAGYDTSSTEHTVQISDYPDLRNKSCK